MSAVHTRTHLMGTPTVRMDGKHGLIVNRAKQKARDIVRSVSTLSKITASLYLGSLDGALQEICTRNIGAVVDLSSQHMCKKQILKSGGNVQFLEIDLLDRPNQAHILKASLTRILKFVNYHQAQGCNVLVHCEKGISRSATVVVAYLMHSHTWSLARAMRYVKSRRGIIKPNQGFLALLASLEKDGGGLELSSTTNGCHHNNRSRRWWDSYWLVIYV